MKNKVICFGEVLWDDFGTTKTIGGAPLNVCYHLSRLGLEPVIVSQVGNDELGSAIMQQLDQWQLCGKYCNTTSSYLTSTVSVKLLDHGEVKYTINENVAWDFIEYDTDLAGEMESADAFVYGTLAGRSSVARATLLRYLEKAPWRVLDLNLRPPYVDWDTLQLLIRSCHCLKINRDELDFIAGLYGQKAIPREEGISDLFSIFENINEIILTRGKDGASYYSSNDRHDVDGLVVPVVDTVGSGDSFLAAFVGGKIKGDAIGQIMEDASVLSAFIATKQGACPSYTAQDLEIFKQVYYEQKN